MTVTSGQSQNTSNIPAGNVSSVVPTGFIPASSNGVDIPYLQLVQSANFVTFNISGNLYFNSAIPSGSKARITGTYITSDAWPSN